MASREYELNKITGRPPSDLAGLRNQVRMIMAAADAVKLGEVKLQLEGLLDDLSTAAAFEWRTETDETKDEEKQREDIAAYMQGQDGY